MPVPLAQSVALFLLPAPFLLQLLLFRPTSLGKDSPGYPFPSTCEAQGRVTATHFLTIAALDLRGSGSC